MSHRTCAALLASVLALAACQVNVAPPDPRRSTKPVDKASAVPSTGASTPASGKPSPAVTASQAPGSAAPTQAAGEALLKPSTPTATLRGTVAIDASYLVDARAGSVISNAGASLAAVGQGLLLSNNSGSLVSNNSGSLIANNSGNIISDKGAGIISDKGAGYLLAQAAEAPAFGATLPAAGMDLRVVSLVDGKPVAIGVDAAGKPVYGIYTNLGGAFEVYVPAELTGTVRVLAQAPATSDARLSYALFARTDREDAGAIDEDSAAMTRYVRLGLVSRFLNVLRSAREAKLAGGVDDAALVPGFFPDAGEVMPAELVAFLGTLLGEIIAEAEKNPKIGPEDYPKLAERLADVVFAGAPDLAAIETALDTYVPDDREVASTMKYGLGPAIPNMTAILKELRLAVVAAGAGKTPAEVEAFFAGKPYIQTANRLRPAGVAPYRIRKAADLADFLAEEYVPLVRGNSYDGSEPLTNGDIQDLSKNVFVDLGLPELLVKSLYGNGGAITLAMVPAAIDPTTKAAIFAVMQGWTE